MFRWLVLSTLLAVIQNTWTSQNLQDGRIVGGTGVPIFRIPYQVSLQYLGEHFCGGTLITEWFVISAAHCTNDKLITNIAVRIGSSWHNKFGVIIPAARIVNHPNYKSPALDYDVSVITLSRRQLFTKRLPHLPSPTTQIPDGAWSIISGWGENDNPDEIKFFLRAAVVPIVNHEQCNQLYQGFITNQMLCAGYPEKGGVDSCVGDGGGPLIVNETLIGIVSWGKGCGEIGFPGVYTSVPSVVDWIGTVITTYGYQN